MQALCVLDTHELNKWVWKKNEKAVSCYYSNNGIIYTMNLTFQHWFLTCPLQRCRTAVFKTGFFKDQTVTIQYSITSLQGRKGPMPVLCSSSISLCYHLYLLDKWFYDLQMWSFTKTTFSKKKKPQHTPTPQLIHKEAGYCFEVTNRRRTSPEDTKQSRHFCPLPWKPLAVPRSSK